MITADGGGSNGTRVRLWKVELQKLADETGLTLHVCHYPPGTSKWNKIEHRLFCHITQNWRGTPLISRQAKRRIDRRDHNRDRFEGQKRTRYQDLRKRRQGHRYRLGNPQHPRRQLPSRMELCDLSQTVRMKHLLLRVASVSCKTFCSSFQSGSFGEYLQPCPLSWSAALNSR